MASVATDHDLLVEIRQDVKYIREMVSDHERRIRVIEQQHNRWLGRDGAIVFGISLFTSLVVAFISWLSGGGLQ